MMKNVQQMRTMLPIGRRDDSSVCTTSFRPGARLITLHTSSDTQCTVKLCLRSLLVRESEKDRESVRVCQSLLVSVSDCVRTRNNEMLYDFMER